MILKPGLLEQRMVLMKFHFLRTSVGFLCIITLFFYVSRSYSEPAEGDPVIHVKKTVHAFPPAFEGAELTHTFRVSNQGTATLNIKKVTHS